MPSKRIVAIGGLMLISGVVFAAYSSTEEKPAVMNSEGRDFFENNVFEESVDFYSAICPVVTSMQSASSNMSIAVENSIDQDFSEQYAARKQSALDSSFQIDESVAYLKSVEWPSEVINPQDSTKPFNYLQAGEDAADTAEEISSRIKGSVHESKSDVSSAEQLNEASDAFIDTVHESTQKSSEMMQRVVTEAKIPNEKTYKEIESLDVCRSLFVVNDMGAGEDVFNPYVEVHDIMNSSHDEFSASIEKFSQQEEEYPDLQSGKDSLSQMIEEVASSARKSSDAFQGWIEKHRDVEEYAAVADEVRLNYQQIADALDQRKELISSASSVDEFGSLSQKTSDVLQKCVNDELREYMRFARLVSAPNEASAQAVQR